MDAYLSSDGLARSFLVNFSSWVGVRVSVTLIEIC